MLVPEELTVMSIHPLRTDVTKNTLSRFCPDRPSGSHHWGLCLAEGGSPDVGLAQCARWIKLRIAVPALQRHISLDGLCLLEGMPKPRYACASQPLVKIPLLASGTLQAACMRV